MLVGVVVSVALFCSTLQYIIVSCIMLAKFSVRNASDVPILVPADNMGLPGLLLACTFIFTYQLHSSRFRDSANYV